MIEKYQRLSMIGSDSVISLSLSLVPSIVYDYHSNYYIETSNKTTNYYEEKEI